MVTYDGLRHRRYGPVGKTLRFFAAWVVGYCYLVGLAIRVRAREIAQALAQLLRIVKFASVGIAVAAIGFGLLFLLVDGVGLSKTTSYLIEAAVSVELNFLGSRYITWRDRRKQSGFWRSWAFFHGARGITFGLNQGLFNLQILIFSTWPEFFAFSFLGFDYGYLLANTACIVVSASFNYAANDEYTFAGKQVKGLASTETAHISKPTVSVIIPCKNSSVGDTVHAVLNQDYYKAFPDRVEIILAGSPDDSSWLEVMREARKGLVRVIEVPVIITPGRDANAKREAGLQASRGYIKWYLDADVQPPSHCLSLIVDRIIDKGFPVVAGPVPSLESDRKRFWPLFIDTVGGKTPRWIVPYVLTMKNLGLYKFPVTANVAFTVDVVRAVGGPAVEFTNSYEDYEWMLRMLQGGYPIMCDPALSAPREHRVGFKRLRGEYVRSGRGCADFMVKHFRNLFTTWRLMTMNAIPLGIAAVVALAYFRPAETLVLGCAYILSRMLGDLVRAKRPVALVFPFIGWFYTICFVYGNCWRFFTRGLRPPVPPKIGRPREQDYTYDGLHHASEE